MTGEVKRYDIYGGILCPDGIGPIMYHADHLAVVEGLRADAERYRAIRWRASARGCNIILTYAIPPCGVNAPNYKSMTGEELDAAIDEAIRGDK